MASSSTTVLRRSAVRRILAVAVTAALAAALAVAAVPGSRAAAASTLLSQGQPTTASSTESAAFPAANATDGNTGTRWSSAFSDPQWLQVDLGSAASITQVVLQWEAAYATAFQIQTSPDGSTWTTIYSTTTGTGGTQTLNVTGTGRYVRMYGTARATQYGYSLWEFQVYGTAGSGGGGGSCPAQPSQPDFGPNVYIFSPSMSSSTIQATLDSVFSTQKLNQFGEQRYALLFKPGTYSAEANIGYYTSIAGLGQNPDDVTINGDVTVDSFDGTGNATQNFWRSAENLAINPSAGSDRWAVAQAGPFRRIDVHGGLELYPASYGYASGGYIADTKVSGQVSSVSQQQWYSRDSSFGSWSGSVWNMVFSGVTGAPAQSFPAPPMTTLATTPVSRDVQTLNVMHADTTILGIGFPTLVPDNGVNAMQVADVNGVRIKGLLFDAGTTNSAALLTVGTAGSTASHASDPDSIQDVFFRIGGDIAGKATASLIVNASDTIVDDVWAWRADHGNSGTVGWTVNTAANGLIVNGSNVVATGLFVEHYQKTEVAWNGQNGKLIFFQNEMPYDPPNQAAWMNGTQNGYPAIAVASNVTSFGAWGLGSYCYFTVNPAVSSDNAFGSPTALGVAWHDLLTVSLGGVGTITHVIDSTGAVTASNTTPSNVVSYP
jgi:F5/8 type C domain